MVKCHKLYVSNINLSEFNIKNYKFDQYMSKLSSNRWLISLSLILHLWVQFSAIKRASNLSTFLLESFLVLNIHIHPPKFFLGGNVPKLYCLVLGTLLLKYDNTLYKESWKDHLALRFDFPYVPEEMLYIHPN